MHTPDFVRGLWKCSRCSVTNAKLGPLLRTRCDSCPKDSEAFAMPASQRRSLLLSLGLLRPPTFQGPRAKVGSLAVGWKCPRHDCDFTIPEGSLRPTALRAAHLRAHGLTHSPTMSPALRKKFLQKIVQDAQDKRQDLAVEFHDFYTNFHRPLGAHLLVPGERNFPRRPSEMSAATAAKAPVLALSATCSVCNQAGRLDAMRLTICDPESSCCKRILLQSLRDAKHAWKEITDDRRKEKRQRFANGAYYKSTALVPFCATNGARIGEAARPGP